jgi:chloramphenicol-sensitive protein RarD
MLGLLQYIVPTMTLLLGVFVYHEPFTKTHFISFLFIWSGLTIYSLSKSKLSKNALAKYKQKGKIGA